MTGVQTCALPISTALVNESVAAKENPFDGELFKDADLQEA